MPETAEAANPAALPLTATVEAVGPSRKKLAITIPSETVADRLRDSMEALSLEAVIPGFRRGRVPRGLVERKFGPSVRAETKNRLVAAAYSQVVEEHKLKVLGDPTGEKLKEQELKDGEPFTFELEVEVLPEFEIPNLDGIDVKRPIIEIKDSMVEDEITKIRINEGTLEERPTPEPGDYLTGHGRMVSDTDGTEFYNLAGAVVQVPTPDKSGRGMILGVLVEDFEKQLGLPKPGDTTTIKVVGPTNHEVEKLRSTPVTITFKVDRVDRIIPAPMDKLLQGLGMQFNDELRTAIRTKLEQRVLIQQQVAMRQQVAKYLIDKTEVTLPERLTAQQTARNLERRRVELMYRGFPADKIEEHMAELRAASGEAAARELKLFFILNRIADELKVGVDEQEMNARIAQIAFERNMRPERLRQEIIQRNQAGVIFQQIREHKTMDVVLGRANVSDLSAEEFSKLFANQSEV